MRTVGYRCTYTQISGRKGMSDQLTTSEVRRCACATIRRTDRVLTRFYDEILAPSGLYVTQFTLLAALSQAAPVTIKHLAGILIMDRTTLTRDLEVLAKQHLVRIEEGEDRARAGPGTLRRPADRPLRGSRGGQIKSPLSLLFFEWLVVFLRKYVWLHQRKVNKDEDDVSSQQSDHTGRYLSGLL